MRTSDLSNHPRLLTDIWDVVFDFLHDDPHTLKSCALINATLMPLIYRRLHRELISSRRLRRLVQPEDITGLALMRELSKSRMLPYVRVLGLEFKRLRWDKPRTPWWAPFLAHIPFQSLTTIRIIRAEWSLTQKHFGVDLAEFLSKHPIRSVELSDCDGIPLDVSLRCVCPSVNVDELRLHEVTFQGIPPIVAKSPLDKVASDAPQLKILRLHDKNSTHASPALEWWLTWINLRDVHTLEVIFDPRARSVLLALLFNTPGLRNLKLTWSPDVAETISLAFIELPALETLHLIARDKPPNLEYLTPPRSLREIYVNLLLPTGQAIFDFTYAEAGYMNEQMNASEDYVGVEKVVFHLSVCDQDSFENLYLADPLAVPPFAGLRSIVHVRPELCTDSGIWL